MKSSNDSHQTRIAVLETTVIHIHESLSRIEQRLERVDNKISGVEIRLEAKIVALDTKIDTAFKALDAKIDNRFFWTLGVIITLVVIPMLTASIRYLHLFGT